jgi:hypothetical protein
MRRAPPHFALAPAAAFLLPVWGCQETVTLGAECPAFRESCPSGEREGDGGDTGEPPQDGDAGPAAIDGAAHSPADAGDDGSDETPVFGIRNPSFELTRGNGGEISKLGASEIEPWYTCRDGLTATSEAELREESDDEPRVTTAQDGETLVTLNFPLGVALGAGLFQELERPLRKGQHVAFMIDVRNTSADDDPLSLVISGTNTGCIAQERLAESREVTEAEGWFSLCMRFDLPRDYEEIALEARSSHALLGERSRLLIDHIRTSPDCR